MEYTYKIYYEKGMDGYIIAECPAFDACRTQGKSIEEARERIKEVLLLCIEEYKEENRAIPNDIFG